MEIKLSDYDMKMLIEGYPLTVRLGDSSVVLKPPKARLDFYTDKVVEGLELKYGKGNF